MDNWRYRDWIVRYICHNEDGSTTQFHMADFDKKKQAERFIRRKNRRKLPNEKYELIQNCLEEEKGFLERLITRLFNL